MKKHLIVCPVDYSACSESAIEVAAHLAKARKSRLVLLNVTEPGKNPLSLEDSKINQINDRIRNQFLSETGIEFESLNLRGNPADVVVEYAKKQSADLIVMGTHGRTGIASVMVGSVAKAVMSRASCTVITVKMANPSVPT